MDLNVPEIDVKFPLYPIRGSFTKYQCKDPKTDYIKIPGKTCNRTENPDAKGYCYKTTFGDWSCNMIVLFGKPEDSYPDVAPPGARATAAENKTDEAKAPMNDKTANQETSNQTAETKDETAGGKDENGFVKPDFSEMKKYFEVVKSEYDFSLNKFTVLVKMKKATSVCDWYLTFYDADGVKMRENSFAGPTCTPELGEPTRIYSYTPPERDMKGVAKIVITRKVR